MAHPAKQVHKQSTPLDRAWPKPHPIRAQTEQVASQSPDSSVLRANPFPEVTDLTCRLPVSTLFYRLEAIHLGDLLRISVRSRGKIISLLRLFKGHAQHTRCHKNRGTLRKQRPYLRLNRFQGVRSLTREEISSSGYT